MDKFKDLSKGWQFILFFNKKQKQIQPGSLASSAHVAEVVLAMIYDTLMKDAVKRYLRIIQKNAHKHSNNTLLSLLYEWDCKKM